MYLRAVQAAVVGIPRIDMLLIMLQNLIDLLQWRGRVTSTSGVALPDPAFTFMS
jgi:hypothetical protein